uniref:Uncharacterized protein n=1 Tax=Anguilla anguilla TaxID=7936 RepID=A0A0E9Q753_ANGAN
MHPSQVQFLYIWYGQPNTFPGFFKYEPLVSFEKSKNKHHFNPLLF